MAEPFTAYISRGKTAVWALISAALAAAVVATAFRARAGALDHGVGAVGIAFFGGSALILLRQLVRAGPVLEIGREGLLWRRWSNRVIPWKAFTRAETVGSALMLTLADPTAYRSRSLLGLLAPINRRMGIGDVAIPAIGLDCSLEDLAGAIRAHRPSLLRR